MSFTLHRPETLQQAFALQTQTGGVYLAGGTVLMVKYNQGVAVADHLIDLSRISSLHECAEEPEQLVFGALVTFDELEQLAFCRRYALSLWQAACEVGGPQVRNRATLGGNLCAASPSADAATPLLALGAEVELTGPQGVRRLALDGFFTGPGKTVLASDEIMTRIFVPKAPRASLFCKVGKRNALAVSCINMAVAAKVQNGLLSQVSVAVGAAAPTVLLCPKTMAMLEGQQPTDALLKKACASVQTEIAPIDDRWASAEYRRTVCANLLRELIPALDQKEDV